MAQVQKDVIWAVVNGQKVALSQTYDAQGNPQLVSEATPMPIKGSVQLSGSYVEYRVLSTDTQPTAKPEEKGATKIFIDTGEVFMNNGSGWVVF